MKENKGITLIALIVTIIVLIILAGVAIAMLRDENGILNNASTARSMNIISSFDERVKLASMSTKMNITTMMTTRSGYIATNAGGTSTNPGKTAAAANLEKLADEVAKELIGGSTTTADNAPAADTTNGAAISTTGYTVQYYLDDEGRNDNNGDGYIVIWYTDNSLRSSLPNGFDTALDSDVRTDFLTTNKLTDRVSEANINRNQFAIAAVIHVTNYDCSLSRTFATSYSDAKADRGKELFSSTTLYNKITSGDNTGKSTYSELSPEA